jgi:hypothetical protein
MESLVAVTSGENMPTKSSEFPAAEIVEEFALTKRRPTPRPKSAGETRDDEPSRKRRVAETHKGLYRRRRREPHMNGVFKPRSDAVR